MSTAEVSVRVTRSEDKKHSVVYKPDPSVASPALTSVYIMRSAFPAGMPQKLDILITAVEESTS